MLKKLVLTTAIGGLMIGSAMAQSTGSGSSALTSSPSVVSSQKSDQWLASSFKGTDVIGSDNNKIGDVSDILFDKNGSIQAYVISVGGFLGVGSKEIALAPSSFQVVSGNNGSVDQLKISMSADQLKQAANFEPYNPPRPAASTTGSGGLGTTPMMPRSSTNTPPASTNR